MNGCVLVRETSSDGIYDHLHGSDEIERLQKRLVEFCKIHREKHYEIC